MHSFGTNSFYFLCAPYFYSKMDELGLLEFNPYEGKKYSEIYSGENAQNIDFGQFLGLD